MSVILYFFSIENNYSNSTLQFRPIIPRRPSIGRLPASHNLLVTSQIHNHYEQKLPARHFDSDIDHDEGIDSATGSRSLSINTVDEGKREVKSNIHFFLF